MISFARPLLLHRICWAFMLVAVAYAHTDKLMSTTTATVMPCNCHAISYDLRHLSGFPLIRDPALRLTRPRSSSLIQCFLIDCEHCLRCWYSSCPWKRLGKSVCSLALWQQCALVWLCGCAVSICRFCYLLQTVFHLLFIAVSGKYVFVVVLLEPATHDGGTHSNRNEHNNVTSNHMRLQAGDRQQNQFIFVVVICFVFRFRLCHPEQSALARCI